MDHDELCVFSAFTPLPRLTTDTARAADQWDVQDTVKRIVAELQRRKFLVWFDRASPLPSRRFCDSTLTLVVVSDAVERMKGSVMVRLSVDSAVAQ